MATVFSHALVAYTLCQAIPSCRGNVLLIGLAMGSAAAPDLDVFLFQLGIPWDSPLAHRGITHSVSFALLWAVVCIALFAQPLRRTRVNLGVAVVLLFFATVSHGILDALTNGGSGIAFLSPFSNERYFFPFRPIEVSPFLQNFFSRRGLTVLASEAVWVALPCLAALVVIKRFSASHRAKQP